jgi:hypothetical protein
LLGILCPNPPGGEFPPLAQAARGQFQECPVFFLWDDQQQLPTNRIWMKIGELKMENCQEQSGTDKRMCFTLDQACEQS